MPRFMSKIIKDDKIKNEYVRGCIGVISIMNKSRLDSSRSFRGKIYQKL